MEKIRFYKSNLQITARQIINVILGHPKSDIWTSEVVEISKDFYKFLGENSALMSKIIEDLWQFERLDVTFQRGYDGKSVEIGWNEF